MNSLSFVCPESPPGINPKPSHWGAMLLSVLVVQEKEMPFTAIGGDLLDSQCPHLLLHNDWFKMGSGSSLSQ